MGIGDSFWSYGKDFHSYDEFLKKMKENYLNKEALIMELVKPHPDYGVHSYDILTIRTPDGEVKVLNC